MAAHVEQVEPEPAVAELEQVEDVAAQLGARLERPRDRHTRQRRRRLRDERALDARAGLEIAPHAQVRPLERAAGALELELGAHPRVNHREVERLGDVVVRAQLEGPDHILVAVARSRHDDRQLGERARAAQLGEHLEAVHPGHHHVEEHEIEGLGGDQRQGGGSVRGDRDRVAAPGQPARQHVAVVLVVVDDQQPAGVLAHAGWVRASRAAIFAVSRAKSTGLVS